MSGSSAARGATAGSVSEMAADYDVIVIGGGLAGLTAGLFSARYGRATLVVEAAAPGGHLNNVEKIEDFPGFPEGVPGYDLCPMVQEQAERYGAQFELAEVEGLEPAEPDGHFWRVTTSQGSHTARAVILATGMHPRTLGIPREEALYGRGVSHCATCDGPFFRGRTVGVVGGGDHALQEALTLAGHASRVIILNDTAAFSGQATYRTRVAETPKIEARHNVAVEAVLGEGAVSGVRIHDTITGAVSDLELAGLFVYIGQDPNTSFLPAQLRLTAGGHVPTDAWMRTELPGLFAAGDIRADGAGHAITSAGDGATAAIAAHRYVVGDG